MSGASTSRIDEEQPLQYAALKSAPAAGPRKVTAGRACRAFTSALLLLVIALLLGGIVFLLWPTSPDVEVTSIKLDGIDIEKDEESSSIIPSFSLDVSLKLLVQITNTNLFGLRYDRILVHILYRGDEVGQVESAGGSVPGKSVSNVTATLDLQGKEILDNVGDLWDDVSNNSVPFRTITEFSGTVDLLFFHPTVRVNSTCDLVVDPDEKVILSQECDLDF